MSYLENKVNESFIVAKDSKNQGSGGNRRIISAVEGQGRGSGGRGRGHGSGRGRGRGHSNVPFFNGVDCLEFQRRSHPSEMQQMGAEVNYYITPKRTDTDKKIYGDEYLSKRDVKEKPTTHCSFKEEEE